MHFVSFGKDLGSDWNVQANAGGSIKQRRNNAVATNTGQALTVPNFFSINNTQLVESTYDIGEPIDIQSLYAFGSLSYKKAIYLDVTGRNDWSSTLPADSRSFFYPSFGISTVLTDLIGGMSKSINYAKVRASWTQVGNSAPPFMITRTANFIPGGRDGFLQVSSTLPNENLKPERTARD